MNDKIQQLIEDNTPVKKDYLEQVSPKRKIFLKRRNFLARKIRQHAREVYIPYHEFDEYSSS